MAFGDRYYIGFEDHQIGELILFENQLTRALIREHFSNVIYMLKSGEQPKHSFYQALNNMIYKYRNRTLETLWLERIVIQINDNQLIFKEYFHITSMLLRMVPRSVHPLSTVTYYNKKPE